MSKEIKISDHANRYKMMKRCNSKIKLSTKKKFDGLPLGLEIDVEIFNTNIVPDSYWYLKVKLNKALAINSKAKCRFWP